MGNHHRSAAASDRPARLTRSRVDGWALERTRVRSDDGHVCSDARGWTPVSSDEVVRARVDGVEVFEFGTTPYTAAPVLDRARVAIVTTAGLRADGEAVWSDGQGFVVLDGAERDLTLAQTSPNFDRTGVAADLNVVYPVDRLAELAAKAPSDRLPVGTSRSWALNPITT